MATPGIYELIISGFLDTKGFVPIAIPNRTNATALQKIGTYEFRKEPGFVVRNLEAKVSAHARCLQLACLLLVSIFVCSSSASNAPCPSWTGQVTGMTVVPREPKIGEKIQATVPQKFGDSYTVCLDDTALDKSMVTRSSPDDRTLEFMMPGNPISAPVTGQHRVLVIADGNAYRASIGTPPELQRVTSALAPDQTFVVELQGRNFDYANKSFNTVQLNGNEILDICWLDTSPLSGQGASGCDRSTVPGYVTPSRDAIHLARLDPIKERSASFQVFINGSGSGTHTDSHATNLRLLAIVAAAAVTIIVLGIVVGLVWKYLRPTVIEGDSYVVRALLLDKETNTYSLSKLQFYLWTIVAVFGYAYLAISKNWFQSSFILPPVPSGLPGIVGIAAGTAVGAQVVTNINGPKGSGQLKPSLADFVTTGDVVAAERVQFFVWTVIGALGFLMVVLRLDPRVLKELPDVPSSILAISGLSAFGYLGGKLARDPGPVVTEAMVSTGPDPDATATTGKALASQSAATNPQTSTGITAAKAQIAIAKQNLQAIAASAAIQAVLAAANRSCDAAATAIQAAESVGEFATVSAQVQKWVTDSDTAAREAAAALTSLPQNTAKIDSDNANAAASAAQKAAAAAQSVAVVLKSSPATSTTAATIATSVSNLGRIELRGRMLSRDANFRVSSGEDDTTNQLNVSFDLLQPSPNDDQHQKKPRVVERDLDSTDPNMAKRLLLIINLVDNLRPVFAAASKHTITVINPDSQKAVFKFQVPESQKAV